MPNGSVRKTQSIFPMNKEPSIRLIIEVEQALDQSQRFLSERCGASFGSINYCLNALIKKGCVKSPIFLNAQNKLAYAYIPTPAVLNHRKELTMAFLKLK